MAKGSPPPSETLFVTGLPIDIDQAFTKARPHSITGICAQLLQIVSRHVTMTYHDKTCQNMPKQHEDDHIDVQGENP